MRQAVLDRDGRVVAAHGGEAPAPLAPLLVPGADARAACAALGHAPLTEALRDVLEGHARSRVVDWSQPGSERAWQVRLARLEGEASLAAALSVEEEPESALRRERDLYRAIYRLSTDGIALIDAQGVYISQNPAHQALLGWSDQELEGRTPSIHMGSETFARVAAQLAAGGVVRDEVPSVDSQGRQLVLGLSAYSIHDASGRTICHVGIKRDMTERRAVENELRLRADLQRALNDLLSLGLREVPRDEQVHRALITLAGMSSLPLGPHAAAWLEGELAGAVGIEADALPSQLVSGRCPCGRALEGDLEPCPGQPEAGAPALRWRHLALPLQAAGRDLGLLLLFPREGPWPPAGKPFLRAATGVIAATVARRRAEEQAREGELRLRELADTVPGVIYQFQLGPDGERRLVYASERLRELLGIDLASAQLGDPFRFIHPEDRQRLQEAVQTSARTLENVSLEVREAHSRSGELRWWLVRSSPRAMPDGGVLWSGVALDVTDRRRAEEELQRAKEAAEAADRAKSRFLANVSHEIRTPLNAVIGMAGLLQETALAQEQRDYARTIQTGGEQLLTLIDDLLDLARVESERLELDRRPFELRACIEGAVSLLAGRAAEKGLDLAWLAEGAGVPAQVIGDIGRLRQVLVNLLGNAVKFTERGEVCLVVSKGPGDELRFEVRDTGVGIPAERMERLFRAFSQVDPSSTRSHGGTGLGLVISKRLVELMGGTIEVDSRPGEGSVFRFTVQLPAGPAEPGAPGRLSGRRLLLGAPHAGTRQMVAREARRLGLLTTECAGAAELVGALAANDYDVVVVDEALLGAQALCEALRARARAQVSLYAPGRHAAALPLGISFAARLMKPPALGQLEQVLTAVLVAPPPEPAPSTGPGLARLRILVAEDQEVNRRVLAALLQHLGQEADMAEDGEQACALSERNPYDLVLMDLQMPRMDGLAAARRIRGRLGPAGGPRIVAITASALDEERERCRAAGIDQVLVKPIGLADLQRALAFSPGAAARPADGGLTPSTLLEQVRRGPAAELGAAGLRELAAVFLADTPGLLARLRDGARREDLGAVIRSAHALKGSCLTLGMTDCARLCEQVELAARAGQLRTDAAARLAEELGRAEAALGALVELPD